MYIISAEHDHEGAYTVTATQNCCCEHDSEWADRYWKYSTNYHTQNSEKLEHLAVTITLLAVAFEQRA